MSMLEGKVRYDGVLLSNVQCRSLPGQALIARLPRQWPQTQIACLADLTEQQSLPSAGALTFILPTEPASSIARQISSQIRDDSLDSTKPA